MYVWSLDGMKILAVFVEGSGLEVLDSTHPKWSAGELMDAFYEESLVHAHSVWKPLITVQYDMMECYD